MKKLKAVCLLVFFLCVILLLSACGAPEEPLTATPEPTAEPEPLTAVLAEYSLVLDDGQDLIPMYYSGGCFYCISEEKTGESIPASAVTEAKNKKRTVLNDGRYDQFSFSLYKVSPNGHMARLDGYRSIPAEENSGGWKDFSSEVVIDGLKRRDNGTFVSLEHTVTSGNSMPSEKRKVIRGKNYLEYAEKYYLRTLDKDGAELLSREISNKEAKAMLSGGSFSYGTDEIPFDFTDAGIMENTVASSVSLLKNGGYRFLTSTLDSEKRRYSHEIITVKLVTVDDPEEYTVLKLGSTEISRRLREETAGFNRENMGKSAIRLVRLDNYDSIEDTDLLVVSASESKQLAAQGKLTGLYSFMELEDIMERGSFLQNILSAAEYNGDLYCTCSGFDISTLIGPASAVGNRCSWSYIEFLEAWASQGQGTDSLDVTVTREDVYNACFGMDGALMNEDELAQLESFCLNFQDTFSYPGRNITADDSTDLRVRSKHQLLMPVDLCCFDDVILCGYEFGEEIAYIGWPTLHGTGSTITVSTFDHGKNLAMTSECRNQTAAWQFLRRFFTAEYQNMMRDSGRFFPSRKASFAIGLNSAMNGEYAVDKNGDLVYDENGKLIFVSLGEMYLSDWTPVRYYPVSAQRGENFRILAESVSKLSPDS